MRLPADLVATLRPSFEGRTVCVTGGAGFIGGHTVDALLSLGANVTVIDDLSNSTPAHLMDLMEFEPQRLRFVHASILDPSALRQAIENAELVLHLAAMGSVPRSIEEPTRTFAVNADGTVCVLQACRRVGVRRLVLASSSSVYGSGAHAAPAPGRQAHAALPEARTETMALAPMSPYAASKLAAEAAVAAWSRSYGLSALSVRYFNVFGPRQPAGSAYAAVVPAFVEAYLHSKPPVIYGDGSASRDFTPVANVVAANLLALSTPTPLAGQAVNIGLGRAVTVLELARALAERCRTPHLHPRMEAARLGDVPHSLADITLARALIAYQPVVTFEQGLDEVVAFHRKALAEA